MCETGKVTKERNTLWFLHLRSRLPLRKCVQVFKGSSFSYSQKACSLCNSWEYQAHLLNHGIINELQHMIFKWNIIESISQQHEIWSATAAIYPELRNSSYNDLVLSFKWRWIVQFIFLCNYSVSDRMSSCDNHLTFSIMTSDYHCLGMEN